MGRAAEQDEAVKVTRDGDSKGFENPDTKETTSTSSEKMSREANDTARSGDIQQQCAQEQNDSSFSLKGLNAYLGRLADQTASVVLDRTGNAGNSTYAERLDANRRHRLAECMREKQK